MSNGFNAIFDVSRGVRIEATKTKGERIMQRNAKSIACRAMKELCQEGNKCCSQCDC
jgi:hypothetical protein